MKKEKQIRLLLLAGSLFVFFTFIVDAITTIPANTDHFLRGFGFGLMIVSAAFLWEIKRKKTAK